MIGTFTSPASGDDAVMATCTPLALLLCLPLAAMAAELPLLELDDAAARHRVVANTWDAASAAAPGSVAFQQLDRRWVAQFASAGSASGWPGMIVRPAGETWDLGGFTNVSARIVNTGSSEVRFVIRVDPKGRDSIAASRVVRPNQSEDVSCALPGGAASLPVSRVLVFANGADGPVSFTLHAIVARN